MVWSSASLKSSREYVASTSSGYSMLLLLLILAVAIGVTASSALTPALVTTIVILCSVAFILTLKGFYVLQPNQAAAILLFGSYNGTDRATGLRWVWPWVSKSKLSARANNIISEKIKVNDLRGNPIEIGAVVVWRVQDTAQAIFDVEDFQNYVRVQSESALRHLASAYAYDHGEENEVTLRSGVEEVSQALKEELQARLEKAGVQVEEARLTHLAYAPEIAQTMLRRQQAEAVIAARRKIVHGAVSMVDMALKELAEKEVVHLDDERRAAMVSNLMVVLCGESEVHPVVNTGTLYT